MSSSAPRIFDANTESFFDFIAKPGRGLIIPIYQRDYAWEKSNAERLIDDTVQGLGAMQSRPEQAVTFIGTIIAINDSKKQFDTVVRRQMYESVLSIIDGQQRLSTIMMLSLVSVCEIEILSSRIEKDKNKFIDQDAQAWIEELVNKIRGDIDKVLFEKQNNGDGAYQYYPKLTRAYSDVWSYEPDKAKYFSPIPWIIFEYLKLRYPVPVKKGDQSEKKKGAAGLSAGRKWSSFQADLERLAAGDERKLHCLKIMKAMRSKLRDLRSNSEFPTWTSIVTGREKQPLLFYDFLPDALSQLVGGVELTAKSAAGGVGRAEVCVDGKGRTDEGKNSEFASNVRQLLEVLLFTKFLLKRITIVVVNATSEDFAFDVFEALNSTGQPLTALETFVPRVVEFVGNDDYVRSEEKRCLDMVQDYLRRGDVGDRQQRSAELLVSFALAETGEKCPKSLAAQRRYMREAYENCSSREDKLDFVKHLAQLSSFMEQSWSVSDAPTRKGEKLASDAALCLKFLHDLGHTITIPVVQRYSDHSLRDFQDVVRAVTAFAVLWRAPRRGTDGIDQIYRDLMHAGVSSLGVAKLARANRGGAPLPSVGELRSAFVHHLRRGRPDKSDGINSRSQWVDSVAAQPLADSTVLTRFLLLVALHDTAEDNGKSKIAKVGARTTLSFEAWVGDDFREVEHVAPRVRGKSDDWPDDLYEEERIQRLGNLTLLPKAPNQSLSNRSWAEKRVRLQALANPTADAAQRVLDEAGVQKVKIYRDHYVPWVQALTKYEAWSKETIDERGKLLADFAWARLASWLDWEE